LTARAIAEPISCSVKSIPPQKLKDVASRNALVNLFIGDA